jgi:hypothetical protein
MSLCVIHYNSSVAFQKIIKPDLCYTLGDLQRVCVLELSLKENRKLNSSVIFNLKSVNPCCHQWKLFITKHYGTLLLISERVAEFKYTSKDQMSFYIIG